MIRLFIDLFFAKLNYFFDEIDIRLILYNQERFCIKSKMNNLVYLLQFNSKNLFLILGINHKMFDIDRFS